jgi:hypothetical protein
MRTETVFDLLDAIPDIGSSKRKTLPGLSAADVASLRKCGNNVASLAGETTDKSYRQLARHRNVLSHSILAGFHSCPRRGLLEKIQANISAELQVEPAPNLDFVFGHAVGAGAQALFAFDDLPSALYATFLSWHADFEFGHEDYYKRKNKTIERACIAIEKFRYFRDTELEDWEIFRLPDGRPAVELSFCIDLGKTKYFGHIDLILKHRRTGRIAIGELKTNGYSNPDEASYRNSGQAIGYSLILDSIVGEDADYDVIYMVYGSVGEEWQLLPFAKSIAMKMEWIQDRLIDSGHLQQYFKLEHFPKNGANCLQFNRRCQFYGTCDLVDKEKMHELPELKTPEEVSDAYPVDYYFHVDTLIARQTDGHRWENE